MKYGKEITEKICQSIVELKGRVNACKEVGISYETFTVWMDKSEFSEAIKKAENECLIKGRNIAIQSIFKAMPTSWQAGAWWLERNFKGEFSLRHEITGKDGKPYIPITKIIIETRKSTKGDSSSDESIKLNGKDKVAEGGE